MDCGCGVLNENDPHRLIGLNTWCPQLMKLFGKDWGLWPIGGDMLPGVGFEAFPVCFSMPPTCVPKCVSAVLPPCLHSAIMDP